jgi:hypothetical protein
MFDAWLGYMADEKKPARRRAAGAAALAEMRQ